MALFSECADVLRRTHHCYNIQLCEMFVLRHVLRWCLQLVTILVPKHVAEAKQTGMLLQLASKNQSLVERHPGLPTMWH